MTDLDILGHSIGGRDGVYVCVCVWGGGWTLFYSLKNTVPVTYVSNCRRHAWRNILLFIIIINS